MKYKINYKKALDVADIKKFLTEGLQKLGYKKPRELHDNHYFINGKYEIITWYTDTKLFSFMHDRVEKIHNGATIKFTNEELKLLDSLDLELARVYEDYGIQSITDWLDEVKAHDEINIVEHIARVLTPEYKCLMDTPEDIVLRFYQPSGEGSVNLVVALDDKTVEKFYCAYIEELDQETCEYVALSNKELKLFDSLDFTLSSDQKSYLKQNLTDWLDNLKAKDGKEEQLRIVEKVKEFLKSKGELSSFEVLLEGSIEIYFTFKRVANKNFVISIDLETRLIKKGVANDGAAEYELTNFALSELKLFDMMGFELDPEHYPKRNISDWYAAEWYGKGAKS